MAVKLKVSLDEAKLKQIIGNKQKLIKKNVESVIRNQAMPHLIALIMKGFDSLADRADMLPEDPTNPSNWRAEFLSKLEEDLQQNFTSTARGLMIRIGDKDFLGYASEDEMDPDDQTPLVWLVYYIEGLAGDWGFVSPEVYEEFRGSGNYNPEWGRFGQGFMISREQYESEGWSEVVPFDQIRHPFSGFSPLDIFAEALQEFKLRPFLDKAIKAAVEGRRI